ncbi:uncharacterized protein SCHCODRAFT_01277949 [Schizophyllum commune H4-8]|uniref:uncharacterized protein n=1 Tax=Schizophyllum commune (strain H4-8 / FGSC 9210) TaxID=578458 RepID=UPI00215F2550|nr:uncharacterized protein SCHCODRAFT_01277949 [Schizophyllum commune H4-8]KAI5836599.1 hypothetical protein SCHCODRAFT_01277949 [Schizophyllum commune H4-8]
MKDAADIEPHLWPTEQNIHREAQRLTQDCSPHDRFFFLYAGHAGRESVIDKNTEGDEQQTYIVPCSASDQDETGCISNTDLHSFLVKPLKSQCRLVAFLDACHSATLLVPRDACSLGIHDRGGEATPSRPRQHSDACLNQCPMPYATREPATKSFNRSVTDLRLQPYFDDGADGAGDCRAHPIISAVNEGFARPWNWCQEFCRRLHKSCDPHILCISACKDDESTLEMRNLSMTKILVRALERNPNPSLASLVTTVQQALIEAYESRKRAYTAKRMRKNRRHGSRDDSTWRSVPGECRFPPHTQVDGSPELHTILWPPLGEIQMTSNQAMRGDTERFVF